MFDPTDLSVVIDQSVRDTYAVKARVRSHIIRRMAALDLDVSAGSGYLSFEGDMGIHDPKVTTLLNYCDRYGIGAMYGKRVA